MDLQVSKHNMCLSFQCTFRCLKISASHSTNVFSPCCLQLPCQKLVFNKQFDNQLKQHARGHKNVEEVAENEIIKEEWSKVISIRENEVAEQKVRDKMEDQEDGDAPAETALHQMRRAANEFVENSQEYWNSLANTTVRRYVSCMVLPATQGQMQRELTNSCLKDVIVPEGQRLVEWTFCFWFISMHSFATTLGTLAMDVQSKCRDASCQVVLDLV